MGFPPKGVLRQPVPVLSGPRFSTAGRAIFRSDDPPTNLAFETDGCRIDPPKPKISTVDLMDSIGLTQWVGQDPYMMRIGVRFDGFPDRSVEPDIETLEDLAEVHKGATEPPIVTVDGAVPKAHPHLTWRISDLGDPEIDYVPGGGARCRYFTVVTLVQRVTDRVLIESLHATSRSKGVKARTTTVHAGEDWLYDIARRVYGDPSRASDIATANGLHLGKKLHQGLTLRLP